jgi:t-SNARE complex subunit (syntaxin)
MKQRITDMISQREKWQDHYASSKENRLRWNLEIRQLRLLLPKTTELEQTISQIEGQDIILNTCIKGVSRA